jgi:nicotinamidase-related amidase
MAKKKKIILKIIWGIIGAFILFVAVVFVNLLIFQYTATEVSTGQPIEAYAEQHAALLVIDIQEATTGEISTDTYYKEKSDALIKNINHLTEWFQHKNAAVINVRSEVTNPLLNLVNNSYAKGSIGARFDKRLKTVSGIELVKKKSDAFLNTDLDSILINNKVSEIYIVGLDAAHCVNTTVEAAKNRNYQIFIVEDAVLAKSDALKDSMMVVFRNQGVKVLKMDSLLSIH